MSRVKAHFHWAGKWQLSVPLYMSNNHLYAHTQTSGIYDNALATPAS